MTVPWTVNMPHGGRSNEYQQHILLHRNKNNINSFSVEKRKLEMCPKDMDAPSPEKFKRKLLTLDADGDGQTDRQG